DHRSGRRRTVDALRDTGIRVQDRAVVSTESAVEDRVVLDLAAGHRRLLDIEPLARGSVLPHVRHLIGMQEHAIEVLPADTDWANSRGQRPRTLNSRIDQRQRKRRRGADRIIAAGRARAGIDVMVGVRRNRRLQPGKPSVSLRGVSAKLVKAACVTFMFAEGRCSFDRPPSGLLTVSREIRLYHDPSAYSAARTRGTSGRLAVLPCGIVVEPSLTL